MMTTMTGAHAWLFQFKADEDAEWLRAREQEHRVLWRILRWASETRPGDLIFFWEAGPRGGLRGWGVVTEPPFDEATEMGRRWRVLVHESLWLTTPIPREEALSIFREDNHFLRMPQGSNFRVDPEEARRLIGLMPTTSEAPPLEQLQPHSPESSASSSDEDDPNQSDAAPEPVQNPRDRDGMTLWAQNLLERAQLSKKGVGSHISTTRLLLAAFALADDVSPQSDDEPEAVALLALKRVGERHRKAIASLRAQYLKEQKPVRSPTERTFTDRAADVLAAARRGPFGDEARNRISTDGLIAAILTVTEGRVRDRIRKVGVPLDVLRAEMLRQIALSSPGSVAVWEHALGETLSYPDMSPPTPMEADKSDVGATPPAPVAPALQRFFHIPTLGNDNAWQKGLNDKLGADEEARAFAALAISPNFIPPLAVGVFGEWGAGKSFFMRLVYEHIGRLAAEAQRQVEAQQTPQFLSRVVQIRFNAWHYVDTNLWASLVDHIFTELDKAMSKVERSKSEQLFDQLATARELTLESAERLIKRRKEQEAASKQVAESERQLLETEASVRGSPQTFWNVTKKNFLQLLGNDKADFEKASKRLGIEQVMTDGRAMSSAIHQLDEERGKATLLANGLRRQLGSWPMALTFAGACIVAPLAFWSLREGVAMVLKDGNIRLLFSDTSVAASGVFTAIAAVFAEATRRVRAAIAVVQDSRKRYEEAVESAMKDPKSEFKETQDQLARLNADVAESRAMLAATTERLGEAAREYNAGTGRARLLRFVRERAAGETYTRHLGLVATVRKDFEELAAAMDTAGGKPEERGPEHKRDQDAYQARVDALIKLAGNDPSGPLKEDEKQKLKDSAKPKPLNPEDSIDRIVLYIDDLDRCQPKTVAEVLQAVHLLLSFKLFVVLVAVDVRWVTKALQINYPALVDSQARQGSESVVTAHDYLEKIFQVPYWVRPMTDANSAEFMKDRLQRQRPPAIVDKPIEPTPPPNAPAGPPETPVQGDAPPPTPGETLQPTAAPLATPAPANSVPAPEAAELSRHLQLSEDEERFMERLAHCAGGSPRRVLRFLNVYQVVKASLPQDEGRLIEAGGFHALMGQVAIITGAPDLLERWIRFLALQDAKKTPAELKEALLKENWLLPADQAGKLMLALDILHTTAPVVTAAALQHHAGLARRYSFTG